MLLLLNEFNINKPVFRGADACGVAKQFISNLLFPLGPEQLVLIIIIIIYHDFLPTPGGVVMSSQVKHTHSHQDTPLSPYT